MRALIALLVGVLLLMQYSLWFGKGGIRDVRMMRTQIERQQQEISALKERNQGLAAEVLDLKEGIEAIEERARSEMGMIKKDEVFYQVIEPNNDDVDRDLKESPASKQDAE
ncbi:MAG: cell division protein FtsB [Gammaproteobacteria bacterium]